MMPDAVRIPAELTVHLDDVARGFITAHLWTDAIPVDYDPEVGGSGGLEHAAPGPALEAWGQDVSARFLAAVDPADVLAFMDAYGNPDGGDPGEYVGHNLYLDAAGHGVSFTDRAWSDDDPMTPVCARLADVARGFGEVEHARAFELADGTVDL